MKLLVLAASVGYVLAGVVTRGDDCGPLKSIDPTVDATTDPATCPENTDFCDFSQSAAQYQACDTSNTKITFVDGNDPKCQNSDDASQDASVATDNDAATTGVCTEAGTVADTEVCVADAACSATDSICRKDGCAAEADATKCGAALPAIDGAVLGCCELDATVPVAVTDTAANYCSAATGVGTVTAKTADAGDCTVANQAWCLSGTCTPTTAGQEPGTCAATASDDSSTAAVAGDDGAACLDAVTAVGACNDGLTAEDGGTADDAADDWCKAATDGATALGVPSAGAVGANGGAPRTGDAIIAGRAGDDRCTGTGSTATIVTTGTGDAATEESCTCTAAPADSPAAIFYGMSMVTAAVAYLL